jgi:hypothetical protein
MTALTASSIQHYTIHCGVFLYKTLRKNDNHENWTNRIEDYASFNQYISKTYYQNYINNIFYRGEKSKLQDSVLLNHRTISSFLQKPVTLTLTVNNKNLGITISYFDFFLFSDGIGIFCFRSNLEDAESVTYESISSVLGQLRNPLTSVHQGNESININTFLRNQLSQCVELLPAWDQYLTQLKSYTIINDVNKKCFTPSFDETLFELSHAMPVGTISSDGSDRPTESYFQDVLKQNAIFIYANWKAISLHDSFTRLSCNYPDKFKTWELDYFHIYIHCLFAKFQLYYFNSQITDLIHVDKGTKAIRDKFVEFANDYALPYISFKFLPNLLYEKINSSLEVQKELVGMEKKIEQLNTTYQENKSEQLNLLLLVLSGLSIVSVINDVSQWLTNMGVASFWVYNPLSIVATLVVLGTSIWLIFKRI